MPAGLCQQTDAPWNVAAQMSRQRSGSTVKVRPLPVVTSRARTPPARPPCRTLSRMPPSWPASPVRWARSLREIRRPNSSGMVRLNPALGRQGIHLRALPQMGKVHALVEDVAHALFARSEDDG